MDSDKSLFSFDGESSIVSVYLFYLQKKILLEKHLFSFSHICVTVGIRQIIISWKTLWTDVTYMWHIKPFTKMCHR